MGRSFVALFLLLGCASDSKSPDAEAATDSGPPDCFAASAEWSSSVMAVAPALDCSSDEDCVLVSAGLLCERDGERWAGFLQGCYLPANRDDADRFNADRERLASELCDSLTEPFCWITGCNVDGGSPGVRCVGGLCTDR